MNKTRSQSSWQKKLYIIIFESNTKAGKNFDLILLAFILLSIFTVVLESVAAFRQEYGSIFIWLEWFFTISFTVEYFLRIYSSPRPVRYITSFYGLVDLLSILPTYISYFLAGSQFLIVIRGLRLLRIFRILKLGHFLGEAETLKRALKASVAKIIVFIGAVVTVVLIIGSLMYLIEGPENGFRNIPISIYWAVVTITTVGYGDIAPQTTLGQFLATILMLLGYGIIAVPTGIVSSELTRAEKEKKPETISCPNCKPEDHPVDSSFCRFCGNRLNKPSNAPKRDEK